MNKQKIAGEKTSLAKEAQAFLVIAVGVIPALTIALIAAYGFALWASQLFLGPPGH